MCKDRRAGKYVQNDFFSRKDAKITQSNTIRFCGLGIKLCGFV